MPESMPLASAILPSPGAGFGAVARALPRKTRHTGEKPGYRYRGGRETAIPVWERRRRRLVPDASGTVTEPSLISRETGRSWGQELCPLSDPTPKALTHSQLH